MIEEGAVAKEVKMDYCILVFDRLQFYISLYHVVMG